MKYFNKTINKKDPSTDSQVQQYANAMINSKYLSDKNRIDLLKAIGILTPEETIAPWDDMKPDEDSGTGKKDQAGGSKLEIIPETGKKDSSSGSEGSSKTITSSGIPKTKGVILSADVADTAYLSADLYCLRTN